MLTYLLHFGRPFGHARHYLGSTPDDGLERRMREHGTGRGARLTIAVHQAGIPITLARVWHSPTRSLERELKARKSAKALCPVCQAGETDNPVLTYVNVSGVAPAWCPPQWTCKGN